MEFSFNRQWLMTPAGIFTGRSRTVGVYFGLGLIGVWSSIAVNNYFRAMFLLLRYSSFKWIKKLT